VSSDILKSYYERDANRFWDPSKGLAGRDLDVYPLLNGYRGKMLEYGCGSGSLLLGLAREDRFSQCYGVDISENALEKIGLAWNKMEFGQKYPKKVIVSQPVNDCLPDIPSSTFDVVISVATIEHVLDPYIVLDELHRIAKHDGVLICSVPNYAYLKHRLQLLFGIQPRTGTDEPVEKWRHEGWDGMHLHTFTKSSFTTLLQDCGWQPQRWLGCGTRFNSIGLGVLRRNFPGLWSGEIIALCRKRD
jgi:SAM-dependent methyltransferase